MAAAISVMTGYERELRRVRLHRLVRRGTAGLFAGGLLVVASIPLLHLLAGRRPDAGTLALLWVGGLAVGLAVAATGLRLSHARRRAAARSLDRRAEARGAILAALEESSRRQPSRFLPLLEHRAGTLAERAPNPRPERLPVLPLSGTLGCIALSTLLLLFSRGMDPRGASAAFAPGRGTEVENESAPVASRGEVVVPDLSELARLELATESRIVLPREEPQVWITLRQKGGVGRDVPLETLLTFADGTPSVDVGLGVGIRPLPLDLPFTLQEQPGAPTRHRVSLKPALEKFGMWRPGLITIQALARPGDEDADVVGGGLVSNQLTIQIAENRERQRIRKPTPTEKSRTPKKSKPEKDKQKKGQGKHGGQKPELGAPDRMPGAKRKASAVKPLISDGPQVEKEVDVYERERGGEASPPPRKTALPPPPQRTFLERAEAEMMRLPLSPEDRVLLKRYFERLRR